MSRYGSSAIVLSAVLLVAVFAGTASSGDMNQPPTSPDRTTNGGLSKAGQTPVFPSGTELVLLDMVVRGKGGQLVPDLRADEVQVSEDGKPCAIQGFRLVQPETAAGNRAVSPASRPRVAGAPAPRARAEAGEPRLGSLVLLTFDQLAIEAAVNARRAALDFVGRPFPPNTWFAVFKIGAGLRELQPLTEDRSLLKKAIEQATAGVDRPRDAAVLRLGGNATREALELAMAAKAMEGTGAPGSPNTAEAEIMRRMAEMLRMADLANREEKGRGSLYPLLALSKGLGAVSGRKTLLYFSEGLNVPPDLAEVFRTTVSEANRANVALYAIDARPLAAIDEKGRAESPFAETKLAIAVATAVSGDGSPEGIHASETIVDALRLNLQGNLRDIAESTGGFLIANTNDLRPGLERVGADLRNYYEIAYLPPNPKADGRWRGIEVKVARPGVTVRTRRGYFAFPPGASVVLPYELPLVAALAAKEPPRDFEYRTSALVFGPKGQEREAIVQLEVPLGTVQVTKDDAAQRYRIHLSALAHVKDPEGRIVAWLSEDWPVDGPLDQATNLKTGQATFKRVVSLAPGRYTLETAVQDRTSGQTSVGQSSFEVPATGTGPALALFVVRRTDPAGEGTSDGDPLRLPGMTVVPDFAPTLHRATRPELPVFLSVYPVSGSGPVSVDLELRSGDTVLDRTAPELPPADANGRVAALARFSTATLLPGRYEVRAVAHQGPAATEGRASFEVLPDLAPRVVTRPPVPPAVSVGPKAEKPDAATAVLLEKVGRYVADYERSFSNLVAEETYNQRTEQVTPERDAPLERRRSLRSDIVFVTLPGPIPWGTFRDVFEVDGRPIRDRQARLQSLFAKPPADALVRANAILRESARYNLGSARRTINIPTLALLFLHPANQERFTFKTKGRERIQGHEAVVLEFKEIARPTLVRESSQGDLPAKGRFWLDPDRGIVLRSEVEYRFEPNRALAWVATEFRAELGLEIWVPAEMKERYEDLPNDKPGAQVFVMPVEATARYANYQRFSAEVTSETARIPEDKPPQP